MIRFIVLRHSGWKHLTAVHHLFRNYSGESIDGDFVLLKANIHSANLSRCEVHPDMFVLPSIYSSKPVSVHAQEHDRTAHYLSLEKLGITAVHTTAAVAGIVADRYGPKFSLEL